MTATEWDGTTLCRFEDLAIGEPFRFAIPFPKGIFFKTGPESYGIAPGEAEWDLAGQATMIVRRSRGPDRTNVIELFPEVPPRPGSGALKEAA